MARFPEARETIARAEPARIRRAVRPRTARTAPFFASSSSAASRPSAAGKSHPHRMLSAPKRSTTCGIKAVAVDAPCPAAARVRLVSFRCTPGKAPEVEQGLGPGHRAGRRPDRAGQGDRAAPSPPGTAPAGRAASGCRPWSSAGRPGCPAPRHRPRPARTRRSPSQSAWPGMVLPVVNSRNPGQALIHPSA